MQENKTDKTTYKRTIGKVTYIIQSSASSNATDTLEKKIEKLVKKNAQQIQNS